MKGVSWVGGLSLRTPPTTGEDHLSLLYTISFLHFLKANWHQHRRVNFYLYFDLSEFYPKIDWSLKESWKNNNLTPKSINLTWNLSTLSYENLPLCNPHHKIFLQSPDLSDHSSLPSWQCSGFHLQALCLKHRQKLKWVSLSSHQLHDFRNFFKLCFSRFLFQIWRERQSGWRWECPEILLFSLIFFGREWKLKLSKRELRKIMVFGHLLREFRYESSWKNKEEI